MFYIKIAALVVLKKGFKPFSLGFAIGQHHYRINAEEFDQVKLCNMLEIYAI